MAENIEDSWVDIRSATEEPAPPPPPPPPPEEPSYDERIAKLLATLDTLMKLLNREDAETSFTIEIHSGSSYISIKTEGQYTSLAAAITELQRMADDRIEVQLWNARNLRDAQAKKLEEANESVARMEAILARK